METYKEMKGFVVGKGRLDVYIPPTEESTRWKHWKTILDLKTCESCKAMHGKIWAIEEVPETEPPLHWGCRCVIDAMKAVRAGKGTKDDERRFNMNSKITLTLDLTGCKYLGELHQRIKNAFDFPDYYGCNWDAFYDLLCTENTAGHVRIIGESTMPVELQEELNEMHSVFRDAQEHLRNFYEFFSYEIVD